MAGRGGRGPGTECEVVFLYDPQAKWLDETVDLKPEVFKFRNQNEVCRRSLLNSMVYGKGSNCSHEDSLCDVCNKLKTSDLLLHGRPLMPCPPMPLGRPPPVHLGSQQHSSNKRSMSPLIETTNASKRRTSIKNACQRAELQMATQNLNESAAEITIMKHSLGRFKHRCGVCTLFGCISPEHDANSCPKQAMKGSKESYCFGCCGSCFKGQGKGWLCPYKSQTYKTLNGHCNHCWLPSDHHDAGQYGNMCPNIKNGFPRQFAIGMYHHRQSLWKHIMQALRVPFQRMSFDAYMKWLLEVPVNGEITNLARVCCFYFENESDCQKFIGPPAT
jgi:hypothetical protein